MEIRKNITLRFAVIYFSVLLTGIVIIGKIAMTQTINTGRWEMLSKKLGSNMSSIPANRGDICADDGSILATSVAYYDLRLDLAAERVRQIFDKHSVALSKEVAAFFDVSEEDFLERLRKAYDKKSRWFQVYKDKVSYEQLREFKKLPGMSNSLFGAALIASSDNLRVLPHGDMGSRTIGSLNKGALGGVHGNIGYSGIEGLMDAYLAGEDGLAVRQNFSGRWIYVPIKEAKNGMDVITTINVNLQDFAQDALMRQMKTYHAEWGTVVIMEVATGEVKAIVNLKNVGGDQFVEAYNYAFGHQGSIEPGSTFKLMSMMAAMDHGRVDTTDIYDTKNGRSEYRKYVIWDSDAGRGGVHGRMSMKRIFERSSNVGVSEIITKQYEGREKEFMNKIYNFGLNKPLGLGFAGEGYPFIKHPEDGDWGWASLAPISFGYEIKLTPLQTLTFYNAVANDGKMVKPKFVREIRNNGETVKKFETEVLNPMICSEETIGKAQALLVGACINGTGKTIGNKWFHIAGKTGTAQIANDNKGYAHDASGHKKYFASFVGYFPADNPKYSAIVGIAGPKGAYYGAIVAGPVFREITAKVYAMFLESREVETVPTETTPAIKKGFSGDIKEVAAGLELNLGIDSSSDKVLIVNTKGGNIGVADVKVDEGTVPDVIGMGGSDALYMLENAGLKVKMSGYGKVKKQLPAAGNKLKKGQTVYVELGA